MININGTDVKISGNANEILYELMALKISIMLDEGLMAIDQEAMEQAIQVYKDHDYRFPEVRKFKVHGQDKTEEFKKEQGEQKSEDNEVSDNSVLEDIKVEMENLKDNRCFCHHYERGINECINVLNKHMESEYKE